MTNAALDTQVRATSDAVEVEVRDPRPDTVQTFAVLNAPQQHQLAHDAWHVGLRALMNAYRQAEEARLSDIGKTLVEDVDEQLRQHAQAQEKALVAVLKRYFDAETGELGLRMHQFVGEEGALAHLLEQHLGPRNSVLVETLTKHVGEQSPLFRRLSPTDSEGLVSVLGERLRQVLQQEHSAFQQALDPLQRDGAVGRFIARLREELKQAEDDQAKQLKVALAALDTTKEDSLLNQLRQETHRARAELLQAINPSVQGSPLAVISGRLTDLLAEHTKSQKELLEEARKQNAEFQRDVRETILRIETRRREQLRSSRGGGVFEDAVAAFVQAQIGGHGYVVEPTGNVTGIRPNCKVGDIVISFPADHAFAGCRVVLEAKRGKSYTVGRALEETATARKNRDAGAGIFVLARSHAGPGFQTFARYGHDVVVVWDDEDAGSDPYLMAALMVGLALATRTKTNADTGDLQALQGIEQRLVKELDRLGKIRKSAETIRKQAETIEREVGVGQARVGKILEDAKKTLISLDVELRDEAAERACPIEVDAGEVEDDLRMAVGSE
jgi:hypothetical protein